MGSTVCASYSCCYELTNAVQNSTFYSDGTSKKGYSYSTFDYQNRGGTIIATGLRCVGGGDA